MFDIGAVELLLVVVVAILVIGPKDMPLALRALGRWVGKMRSLSNQFRAGFDSIVREAELEEMEKKWKAQNERIMRDHPEGVPGTERSEMEPTGAYPGRQLKTDKPGKDIPSSGDLDPGSVSQDTSSEGGHAESRTKVRSEPRDGQDNFVPPSVTDNDVKDT